MSCPGASSLLFWFLSTLGLAIVVGGLAVWRRKTWRPSAPALSMATVTERKTALLKELERLSKLHDPRLHALYISKRDVPLVEEWIEEGLFGPLSGRWRGFKVRVAPMDLVKGEPCTRFEVLDYKGFRNAVPWTGFRNGVSMGVPH